MVPQRPDSDFQNTADGACDGRVADVSTEIAMVATVTHVADGIAPWVSFEVERWFTDDLGTSIGLWAPGWDGQVGQRWLVAATRYNLDTGDVIPCRSELATEIAIDNWALTYDGSVEPGSGTPEGEADPAVVAAITEARARWEANGPEDWTATISFDHLGVERDEDCPGYTVRVVVEAGEVVQAVDLDQACAVALDIVPTMDELFDHAEQVAGAVAEVPQVDPEFGFIVGLYASDRSVESSINIGEFVPRALPLTDGSREAIEAAQAAWEASGIVDYDVDFRALCFCAYAGQMLYEVRDGAIASYRTGEEFFGSPEAAEDFLRTVPMMFAEILEVHDREGGRVLVAFDPELHHPVAVYLDPIINAIDDELRYTAAVVPA